MIQLYLLHCEALKSETERMAEKLTLQRRKRTGQYYKCSDKVRSLAGEALTLYALSLNVGALYMLPVFIFNEFGKPSLQNYPDFHYNVSHSGDLVICATSSLPVGVDVQEILDKHLSMTLLSRCFDKEEATNILTVSPEQRLKLFFHYWVAKESYIKCLGKGMSWNMCTFSTCTNPVIQDGVLTEYEIRHFPMPEKYVCAVCTSGDLFPSAPQKVSSGELLSFIDGLSQSHE